MTNTLANMAGPFFDHYVDSCKTDNACPTNIPPILGRQAGTPSSLGVSGELGGISKTNDACKRLCSESGIARCNQKFERGSWLECLTMMKYAMVLAA